MISEMVLKETMPKRLSVIMLYCVVRFYNTRCVCESVD